jgi:hypothetical protein
MSDGLCQINVFDVMESAEKKKIPSVPKLFCEEGSEQQQNKNTAKESHLRVQ